MRLSCFLREDAILAASEQIANRIHNSSKQQPEQLILEIMLNIICNTLDIVTNVSEANNSFVNDLCCHLLHLFVVFLLGDSKHKRSKLIDYFIKNSTVFEDVLDKISNFIFTKSSNVEFSLVWCHILYLSSNTSLLWKYTLNLSDKSSHEMWNLHIISTSLFINYSQLIVKQNKEIKLEEGVPSTLLDNILYP